MNIINRIIEKRQDIISDGNLFVECIPKVIYLGVKEMKELSFRCTKLNIDIKQKPYIANLRIFRVREKHHFRIV